MPFSRPKIPGVAWMVLVVVGLFLLTATESSAQELEVQDLTGQEPTVEALIEALHPKGDPTEEVRARGLRETLPQPVCKIYSETGSRGLASASVALNVHFALDSAELAPTAESTLEKLGEALTSPELRSFCIGIEGHTDSSGSEEYNLELSRRRAERVKRFLVETFAIDSDRLLVSGHGEARPLASNAAEDGRRRNRRVQIQTLGGGS